MEMMGAAFANVINIVIFALMVAGVMKIFQVATTLNEIKDVLKDVRRENQIIAPPVASSPSAMHAAAMQDPDALIRALSAEPEALTPTVVDPR